MSLKEILQNSRWSVGTHRHQLETMSETGLSPKSRTANNADLTACKRQKSEYYYSWTRLISAQYQQAARKSTHPAQKI
jgi:hypothetical protein